MQNELYKDNRISLLKLKQKINMMFKKVRKYLWSPKALLYRLIILFPKMIKSDALYLRYRYYVNFRRDLNLENPRTFNEKLQWLKLHDRRPEYTKMVDKVEAKKYVASIIGGDHIIPTLAVYDRAEDIDFDALPNQFVLKCSHDSGGIVICTDKSKLDREAAIRKLSKGLKSNYFHQTREWPYRNVNPRIIAEQYMSNEGETDELSDYKFFCFDGKARLMFIATDRFNKEEHTKFDFYDMDFNHLPFTNGHPNASRKIEKPRGFEEMKQMAEKLSKGIPHVRIDFYDIGGKVYFGEMTFYHWSGMVPFVPDEWDYKVGAMLQLPVE